VRACCRAFPGHSMWNDAQPGAARRIMVRSSTTKRATQRIIRAARAGDGILLHQGPARRGRWSGVPPFFQRARAVPPLRVRTVPEKLCRIPVGLGRFSCCRDEGCGGWNAGGVGFGGWSGRGWWVSGQFAAQCPARSRISPHCLTVDLVLRRSPHARKIKKWHNRRSYLVGSAAGPSVTPVTFRALFRG
jgi:hypothetical protein